MKAHSFRNRTLSFLLAIVMLVGLIPMLAMPAFATPSTSGIYFTADETYTMETPVSSSALTVEATLCLPNNFTGRGGAVVSNYGSVTDCFGIEIHESGKPRIYIQGEGKLVNAIFDSSCRIDNGTFMHLAITMDIEEGRADCYVNGVLKGSITGLNFPSTFYRDTVYMVGGDYRGGNAQYFKGAMKNLAMYSEVRTAEEIAADYQSGTSATDPALLCAYEFSTPGDAKLADLSPNGVDLVCSDVIGGADFEKSATFTTANPLPENPETLEAWVYMPSNFVDRAGTIFGNYSAQPCLNFEIYEGGKPRIYYRDSAGTAHSHIFSYDLRGKGWVHLALVHDAANGKALCYVNGALAATISTDVAALDAGVKNSVFAVGSDTQGGNYQYFKGRLKDVAVWNDVRSAEEIALSYQEGIKAGSEGLIAYYNMEAVGIDRLKDLSGNGAHLKYTGSDEQYSLANAGVTFSSEYSLPVSKAFGTPARTISAWVYMPTANSDRGTVISNFDFDSSFLFEIYYDNAPRLYYRDAAGTAHSFVFSSAKVPAQTWTYVTMVHDEEKGEIRCYHGGTLMQTLTADAAGNPVNTLDADLFDTAPSVGNDLQASRKQYFKGRLAAVSLYSDVRSTEEIARDWRRGADKSDAQLLAAYDLTQSGVSMLRDLSGNGYQLVDETLGATFNAETTYRTAKNYAAAPETYQAWVYVPKTYTGRPGVILGSYPSNSCINFEIQVGGKPRLYYNGSTSGKRSFVFPVDVRGAWTHVTIVHDVANAEVRCYLNGELASTLTKDESGNGVTAFDAGVKNYAFNIGGDVQNGNLQYFKGRLSGVTLYSDVRSAEEIRADYQSGANLNDAALLADYTLSEELVSSYSTVTDRSGHGYHMRSQFRNIWVDADKGQYTGDYDYSMALVGDTQTLAYRHSSAGYTTAMPTLYQWIVDHVESKNIQYVMGLGDITEQDTAAEWEYAKAAITKMDGVVPYSLIWGMNHDTPASLDAYFADHTPFTDNISGVYTEGSITNAYYNFEVGTTKYMIMALDFGAKDNVLDWASEIIAANPDRRVIITTHGYLNYDGSTLDPSESYAPSASYYDPENNDGDDIWEKLASQHANICMVFSGHIVTDSVVISQQTGVHGNTVTQLLVDPQGIDGEYANGTGMVAMLYFSNGGKDVAVEYYSTIRDKYLPLQTFSVETVAKNGTEEYTTLTEALGAAKDGDTVTLLEDTAPTGQAVVNHAVTLDLNQKALTLPAVADAPALLVKDALTVKNGSMHVTGAYGIGTSVGATLTVQSGTYTATDTCVELLGGEGTVSVTGGSFTHALPVDAAGEGYVIAQATESELYTVIPNTYFTFLGGSLRFRDAVAGKTNIRFGYQFAADFDWETSHWRWSFGYADRDKIYSGEGVNKSADGISSLVITDVPLANYERDIRVQLIFDVVYDGTSYTVYDAYQYRSVRGVADAILAHESESLESIAYAEQILAEIEAAQS